VSVGNVRILDIQRGVAKPQQVLRTDDRARADALRRRLPAAIPQTGGRDQPAAPSNRKTGSTMTLLDRLAALPDRYGVNPRGTGAGLSRIFAAHENSRYAVLALGRTIIVRERRAPGG
jgi:hypothetical protein